MMMISNVNVSFASEHTKETSVVEWSTEDFTYVDYSKLLYGCDYTREITITGKAISGFSEKGEEKWRENKDLVIPALDPEGNMIVGVAESAFAQRELTSVQFPTGMMVDYEDNLTYKVTKRGNFVIAENAFSGNNLREVILPEGVMACLSNSFDGNQIEYVKFPRTIWWIETLAFARNRITTVDFPTTCDFQLEMHGMSFAKNFIKSVRLPDYTEVVNKHVFAWNTGKEPIAEKENEKLKTYELGGQTYTAGVVYMYTDNAELALKDRIHHVEKATSSQKSFAQKLVVNDGTPATQNPDATWTIEDFTVDGKVITGLSESGIAKRATNKHLVIPEMNSNWQFITEIAAAEPGGYGLFASEDEGFDSVYLPSQLKTVGDYAFQNSGLKEVTFSPRLTTIGDAAFQMNHLSSVILPDTVVELGNGAFASNPEMERINLSKGLTEIAAGAFGCSDGKNWMTKLTTVQLREGITKIGNNAFAGNNFSKIVFPSTVKEIGKFAFSTKNYLMTPCEVVLNEGLQSISADAFRNKCIAEINIPTTVTEIHENAFRKQYSDDREVLVTKVYVSEKWQYDDATHFPESEYHKVYLLDTRVWVAEDFVYETQTFTLYPVNELDKTMSVDAWVISGLSDEGKVKIDANPNVIFPEFDPNGKKIQGIGTDAFANKNIQTISLPKSEKVSYDDTMWNTTGKGVNERGDFYIGSNAFGGNELQTLNLPNGVIYVGERAFINNELTAVQFPETIMKIDERAFQGNHISSLTFSETTDFSLQVEKSAFAQNKIKAVQLPKNTEKLHEWAFLQNAGMESISEGDEEEQKGGLVYVYIDCDEIAEHIACKSENTSVVQEVFLENAPSALTPWDVTDFVYDETGTIILGLSNGGKVKIQTNPVLIIPEKGPTGEKILALGDGQTMQGIFVYLANDQKYYTPKQVILPESLNKIGKFTFALNQNLIYEVDMTSITFPENLCEIGQAAFQNSKLEEVLLPDSVTTLGEGAFAGSGNLKTVRLSKNVVDIPKSAFNAGATVDMKLESVVIPEGVKSIGEYAFMGTHVENLTLPRTLTTISASAFQNHQLTEVSIPGGVTSIGDYAFRIIQESLTKGLVTLSLNEGLVSIGKEAFAGNSLTEVELPSTVVLETNGNTSDYIFGSNSKPASPIVILKVADKEKVDLYNTESINRISHKVVYDNLVGTGWASKDFIYDEETASILGWSEFGHQKRKTLRTLVLPETTPEGKSIVSVGEQAFMIPSDEVEVTKFGVDSPNGMTSVWIPKTVTKVCKQAFAQNALTTVDLSTFVEIGERAFYGNDLTKAEMPDTLTKLGEGAFATNDITKLRISSGLTVIPQGAFSMNIRMETVTIPDTITEICATAFAGARLTSLDIPKSVTVIGEKAFHLHHLTELTIPANVKEIGDSAFEGTYKATTLTTLVIEEGVEKIGKYAFKEALLEEVHFPDSITIVGEKPFLNNKGKNGSGIVEVTTKNKKHTEFSDDTYTIKYIGEKELVGKWKLDHVGWWYQNADGSYPYNCWQNIDGKWYYFNQSGYMQTGWIYTGNAWYYLSESGAMMTGWICVGNTWYYLSESGAMITGWVYTGNQWYYLSGSGAMMTGWICVGNTWYCLSESGAMLTGWICVGGKWYYLKSDGAMAVNQWIGNFYVGADGVWII